jgi:hypothetical protein
MKTDKKLWKRIANVRSVVLLAALGVASSAALINCKSAAEEEEETPLSEDAITGVNNALGLGLRYDEKTGTVHATLNTRR